MCIAKRAFEMSALLYNNPTRFPIGHGVYFVSRKILRVLCRVTQAFDQKYKAYTLARKKGNKKSLSHEYATGFSWAEGLPFALVFSLEYTS